MHVKTTPERGERGFALIDAILAVFILSIGVIGAIDLIVTCETDIDFQRKQTVAGLVASAKLEELDAVNALPTSGGPFNFGTEYGLSVYTPYDYTVLVTPIGSAGHSATPVSLAGISSTVAVTVTFRDLRSKMHSVTITGIKTKRL